jgi:hypothetical protein
MKERISLSILMAFVIFLGAYGVYTVINNHIECRAAGGIPHRNLCLNPSAIVELK